MYELDRVITIGFALLVFACVLAILATQLAKINGKRACIEQGVEPQECAEAWR